jgi:cellulose synthase/poly-beta-1,6-N-acetylglucosamine synthase-like glycosyltransferase
VLLSVFLTCFIALAISTAALLALGQRMHFSSRVVGMLLVVLVTAASGELAARLADLPTGYVERAQVILLGLGLVVVLARGVWNPVGQLFFAVFLASALSYLWFAAGITFGPGLSAVARAASFLLLLFEVAALVLASSFTFECCDAVCRTRSTRRFPPRDPAYRPMVSLQLAAYNEPPDMLIQTVKSLEQLDYPAYEVVIVDNNTKDPEVWQPVEEYCRDRPGLRFVHVDPWPGFKSGALNLALARYTHPKAEVVGIIDADYLVDPNWLTDLVGYFAEPSVAYVQTPQDYREYEGDAYLEACYDAYRYFFVTSMPSRNQRNSIIFAGTMGLLRRSAIQQVGGWDEWCITEDAELSLRMLKAGYQGVFVPRSYGRGIMPLTFTSLKSQRFRWCFGGMQILRKHWRALLPGRRNRDNHLSAAQRVDYFFGQVQWLNDLVYFGFTVALLASAVVLLLSGPFGLRPLYGAAVLLPGALVATGVLRALWSLRVRTGIGVKRALLAFVNWLSLSWTVALACVQGLTRHEGVFLRTPKTGERNKVLAALWSARAETLWALVLWGLAVVALVDTRARPFVLALLVWQGIVYAAAPFMSWLNQHTELSAQLERRRRTEQLRERAAQLAPWSLGALAGGLAVAAVALIIGFGGSNPGHPSNPFSVPRQSGAGNGPIGDILGTNSGSGPSTTTPPPTSAPTSTPGVPSSGTTGSAPPGSRSTTPTLSPPASDDGARPDHGSPDRADAAADELTSGLRAGRNPNPGPGP